MPIFVPTHTAPADNRYERVQFVTEGIAACVEQAKAAAGDRDIMLHGAFTAQECLKAGLLDVLKIQLMPVLLGQGRLLFEGSRPNTSSSTLSEHWRHPAYCISAMRYVARDRTDPALHVHVARHRAGAGPMTRRTRRDTPALPRQAISVEV